MAAAVVVVAATPAALAQTVYSGNVPSVGIGGLNPATTIIDPSAYIGSVSVSGWDQTIIMNGGIVSGPVSVSGFDHRFQLYGGQIRGVVSLWAWRTQLHFYGTGLTLEGSVTSGVVRGTLSDGAVIAFHLEGHTSTSVHFVETPVVPTFVPGPPALASAFIAMLFPRARQRRRS